MYLRTDEWCFIHASEFPKWEQEFILKNLKKAQQIRMGNLWSAKKLPDTLKHFTRQGDWYKVPSGIAGYLSTTFNEHYDNENINHPPPIRDSYDYQESAVESLIQRNIWLLHASTWSGKTQMICEIIYIKKRKSLVIVQNLTQMQQMVADITILLGTVPVQISWKVYSKKEQATWSESITVCSIDSRDKINPREYWLILLDEADTYLWSEERRNWICGLSPEYLYALTGTIKVNHMEDKVFKMCYWPTTRLELLHLTPDYVQVLTPFRYILDDIKDFHELKEALYTSEERNSIIVDIVTTKCSGRKGIVFTEHVEHARSLSIQLSKAGVKVFLLIGEVEDRDRERIRWEVMAHVGEVCIVWSVRILWRGFDLPELSYAVLTVCEKFTSSIQQYMGRIIRAHPTKPQPIFYDLVDHGQYLLSNQAKSRLATYKKVFPRWKISIL